MSNITTLPAPLSVTNSRVPSRLIRRSCGIAGRLRSRTHRSRTPAWRRAFLRIDEIQLVVDHPRRVRAQAAIARNQLDLHRPGRIRRVADGDGPDDGALREIPDPDAAADVRRVATVHVQRAQRTDEVTGDHQVVRFVDRDAVRIESVLGRLDRPRLHGLQSWSCTRPPVRVARRWRRP